MQGGANDINQGRSVERAADLRKMVQRGKERDLKVTITNLVRGRAATPEHAELRRLNALIAQIGEEEDVPVIEFNAALADPAKPGLMRAGTPATTRSIPTVAGYQQLGEVSSCRRLARMDSIHSHSPARPGLHRRHSRRPARLRAPRRRRPDPQRRRAAPQRRAEDRATSCARRPRTSARSAEGRQDPQQPKEAQDLQKKGQQKGKDLQKKGEQIQKDAQGVPD